MNNEEIKEDCHYIISLYPEMFCIDYELFQEHATAECEQIKAKINIRSNDKSDKKKRKRI